MPHIVCFYLISLILLSLRPSPLETKSSNHNSSDSQQTGRVASGCVRSPKIARKLTSGWGKNMPIFCQRRNLVQSTYKKTLPTKKSCPVNLQATSWWMLWRYGFGCVKFGFARNKIINTQTLPTIALVYYNQHYVIIGTWRCRRYNFGCVKFGFARNAIIDTQYLPTIALVYYGLTSRDCRHI